MAQVWFRLLGTTAALLLTCTSCTWTSPPTSPKIFKIGLVTDARGLDDKGYNHLAYVGLQKAIADFHIKGDVAVSRTVNDYETNLVQFAQLGYDLVIAVASIPDFAMQKAVSAVAPEFVARPGGGGGGQLAVNFAVIEAAGTDVQLTDLNLPNVELLDFKEQDAGAMVGVVAGLLEKAGKAPANTRVIGAIGGMSVPWVNHFIAGYKWAAQMEDPRIQVLIGYSGDFTDPAKCSRVAKTQIVHKAKILFEVADGCGVGVLQSAGQAHVYSIGGGVDQRDSNPSVIASALLNVDVAAYAAIQEMAKGTFKGGPMTFGVANGGAGYQVDNLPGGLSNDIKTELDSVMAKITSGALMPPDAIS